MPKFGSEGWLVPLDSTFGYKRDNDIFPVVYDLRSWPPPRGPVPPGEASKPRHIYAITLMGNVEFLLYDKDLDYAPTTWNDVVSNDKKDNITDQAHYGFLIRDTNHIRELEALT